MGVNTFASGAWRHFPEYGEPAQALVEFLQSSPVVGRLLGRRHTADTYAEGKVGAEIVVDEKNEVERTVRPIGKPVSVPDDVVEVLSGVLLAAGSGPPVKDMSMFVRVDLGGRPTHLRRVSVGDSFEMLTNAETVVAKVRRLFARTEGVAGGTAWAEVSMFKDMGRLGNAGCALLALDDHTSIVNVSSLMRYVCMFHVCGVDCTGSQGTGFAVSGDCAHGKGGEYVRNRFFIKRRL
jgi:hypothetical protein